MPEVLSELKRLNKEADEAGDDMVVSEAAEYDLWCFYRVHRDRIAALVEAVDEFDRADAGWGEPGAIARAKAKAAMLAARAALNGETP